MTGAEQRLRNLPDGHREIERVRRTLDDTGAEDEGERLPAPDREGSNLYRMHALILAAGYRYSGTRQHSRLVAVRGLDEACEQRMWTQRP